MPPLNSANIVEEQPSPLNIKKKQSLMGAEPGNSPQTITTDKYVFKSRIPSIPEFYLREHELQQPWDLFKGSIIALRLVNDNYK